MGETTKHQKHRQQNHFPTKQVRVVSAWLRHAAGSVNGDNELFSLDLTSPLFTPRFFNLLKITPILSLPPEIDVLQSFLPRCFQQGPGASRAAPGALCREGIYGAAQPFLTLLYGSYRAVCCLLSHLGSSFWLFLFCGYISHWL